MNDYPDEIKICLSSHYYYGSDKSSSSDLSVVFTMKEAVNEDLLRKAAEITLPRYPYFDVKLDIVDETYRLVRNGGPVPVGSELPRCWGKETNDYLWFVLVNGKEIEFHCFHGLSDGGGLMYMARTILCHYLILAHCNELGSDTVGMFQDGPVCKEDEWRDPTDGKLFEDTNDYIAFDPKDVYSIPYKDSPADRTMCGLLYVDEADFMKAVKSAGSTPSLFISAMMAKVAEGYRSGDERKMVAGISAQIKKVMGVPNSYRCLLPLINIDIPNNISELSMKETAEILRSEREDAMNERRMRGYLNNVIQMDGMISAQGTIDKKRELSKYVMASGMDSTTVLVSYTRTDDLGPLSPYVSATRFHTDMRGMPWMIEAVAGSGIVTFVSHIGRGYPDLLGGLCRELENAGIGYTPMGEYTERYIAWGY